VEEAMKKAEQASGPVVKPVMVRACAACRPLLAGPAVALSLIVLPLGSQALAEDVTSLATLNLSGKASGPPDWVITLGAGAEYGPRYPGASSYGLSPVPADFDIRRAGEDAALSAPDDGFSFSVLDLGGFSFGPVASYRSGRSRSDNRDLASLHDISFTFDAGAFAEYWVVPQVLRTRAELRQALHGSYGAVLDLSADLFTVMGPAVVSIGPRLSAANGPYMRTYFGISDDEAGAAPFDTVYQAKAGVQSLGVTAALSYAFSPSWRATVYDNFDRLVGDAADSPIARDGSVNQNTLGLSLSYTFGLKFQ
jgi:MipA family protein